MSVVWRGMTEAETLAFTRALVASGETLSWEGIGRPTVDKHSTGGVGDKTSIVLVPLLAAAGAAFVKMSGRGLGHTGGTLDKLESIPGFRCELSLEEMRAQVRRIGCALVGQTPTLVPADGALYALRDVTATVDSVPLIAGSVMSKKLAGGADTIVLDVKWGSGAFMRTAEEARELARALVAIGAGAGRKTRAVLSGMEQPLGAAVGNALEVAEAVEVLTGAAPDGELWRLVLELGSHQMLLAGLAASPEEARARLAELRDSGAGARKLEELVEAQGGDPAVVAAPERLPRAPERLTLASRAGGPRWVAEVDARGVAEAALELGAGRRKKGDPIDHAAGIVMACRVGDRVEPGAPLAHVHARTPAAGEEALRRLRSVVRLAEAPAAAPDEGYEVIG
jgi:pyrimidine-nucleoside phosphorylase